MAWNKVYQKLCVGQRLQQEIVAAGLPLDPDSGARFYGVLTDSSAEGDRTVVVFYDDITEGEIATVDGVVTAHIPIPWPPEPDTIKDSTGKLYVRAECRPISCTTMFTSAGDTLTIPQSIGTGERLTWDASASPSEFTTEGAPAGMKIKIVEVQFCDSVWLTSGTMFYRNAQHGSYLDMQVLAPNGQGGWVVVDHFMNKWPMCGDCECGTTVDSETISAELPSYLKFRFTITVYESNVTSMGTLTLKLYRARTVI